MTYEIYVDQQMINRQTMNAPMMMHKAQYLDLIKQMSGDSRAMKFKMIGLQDVIWDQFEQKQKKIEQCIVYKNMPYLNKYGRGEE